MTEFLAYTIIGLSIGCIYAIIAAGLVVTYTTTGIFNFAHGAVAMVGAFTFWQFWQVWHINALLSVVIVVFIIAPIAGVIIERLLMRPLHGAPVDVLLVVSLGLLLFLIGLADIVWPPTRVQVLPQFFHGEGFRVASILVSWHEVLTVVALIAMVLGLRLLFTRTRLGIAMRAVVDNPDLVAMAGGRPVRVRQAAWALGFSLAALAGILLAPLAELNILNLALLVLDGYAAAIIGRLRSLPIAVIGGLLIALGDGYLTGYLPVSGFFAQIQSDQAVIPIVVLFIVLILLPQDRLKTATLGGAGSPRVAGLWSSLGWGVALVAIAAVIAGSLTPTALSSMSEGFAEGLVLLSLVLLTGYGGMVSLCQVSFMGLGAIAMSHVGHHGSLVGVLAAMALAGAVGGIVALPTLRLRGLYLALATFAFAAFMDGSVFTQVFGAGGSLVVDRVHIPGLPTSSARAFFVVCAGFFAVAGVGVLALRRSSFGRRLVATNDSPAACATLGVSVNSTKLTVYIVAAALAGVGGALYGGVPGQVSANDFASLLSLVALLLVRVGGIKTVTGALLGSMALNLNPLMATHEPAFLAAHSNIYLSTGILAILVSRYPNGITGLIGAGGQWLRDIVAQSRPAASRQPLPALAGGEGLAAVFLAEEGELVHGR